MAEEADRRVWVTLVGDDVGTAPAELAGIVQALANAYDEIGLEPAHADARGGIEFVRVRQGSIVLDLLAIGGGVVTIVEHGSRIAEYMHRLRDAVEAVVATTPLAPSIDMLRAVEALAGPILRGEASRTRVEAEGCNVVVEIDAEAARAARSTNVTVYDVEVLRVRKRWYARLHGRGHVLYPLEARKRIRDRLVDGRRYKVVCDIVDGEDGHLEIEEIVSGDRR